ncbi:MAG: hypothetical protein J6B72_03200 [Clostridia bacterium]|nr:hypothetical protein [Clostridia bacterium]
MVDSIMTYVAYARLFIVSLFIYVLLVSCVFPRLLDTNTKASGELDRGIKRYTFKGGRAIVYETVGHTSRYIKKYALSLIDGQKYLTCSVDKNISSLEYRVTAYGADDMKIETVSVKERLGADGRTAELPLPLDTAYVSILLEKANGVCLNSAAQKIAPMAIATYVALTVATTAAEMFIIKKLLVDIFELALNYSKTVHSAGYGFTLGTAVLTGIAVASVGLLQSIKQRKRGE